MLHQLFTAHMSGNSVKLGVRLGQGDLAAAVPLAAAVALFVGGIALATVVSEVAARRQLRSVNSVLLGMQVGLLAAFMGYGAAALGPTAQPADHGGTFYALAALAIVGLALQTATLQRASGHRVRTTFVTGVLASFAQEVVNVAFWARDRDGRSDRPSYLSDALGLGDRAEARRRMRDLGAVWLAYLVGAVLGTFLEGRWSVWAMAVPLAALTAIVVADLRP